MSFNESRGNGCFGATFRKGVLGSIRAIISRDKLGELLVLSGKISSRDLKSVLTIQKNSSLPLGQILIEQGLISARQLRWVLRRQQALRCITAVFLFFATLSIFSKKSRADVIEDIPAKMSLVSAAEGEATFGNMIHAPRLFGSGEKRSENMKAFTKWMGMFEAFDEAMSTTEGKKAVSDLQKQLAGFKSPSIYEMAERVNTMMNKKKYILDQNNWDKSDYWATPIEFMKKGGDCEDFSIAKYFALRALGVPESRLRVAIVHDEKKDIPHAVLVVYTENGAVILDNQSKTVLSDGSISHYRPIYSINRQAWWLHTIPDTTVIASAR